MRASAARFCLEVPVRYHIRMSTGSGLRISLASKCRLLFGLAVALIMIVALFLPAQRMEMLVEQLNYYKARQIALAVRARPEFRAGDLGGAAEALAAWWPGYAEAQDLTAPMPALLRLSCADELPDTADAFQTRAVRNMCPVDNTEATGKLDSDYATERDDEGHHRFRYALAIRSTGEHGSPRDALLGVVFVELPPAALEQAVWNRLVILASGAAAGLAAILVFYLITQRLLLSPLRDLRHTADKVSAGDLSVRAGVATGDEFERLGDAFNRMLENLKNAQDELQKTNKSLDVKLGELAEANVALFEADKLKTEFLANVTHELRTPLSSILGFAELLKEGFEGDSARRTEDSAARAGRLTRYANNVLTSARMLLNIINDLLDLAKIEAGRMEIRRAQVVLRDVCESLVDFTKPMSDKKKLTIAVEIPDDLPTLNSDAGKIQQILYNLLSNAIKFTPERGTVRIVAERYDTEHVCLAVTDTGPGIPPEQQAIVFDKFRQADGSVTREHPGTGLGLPISRDLARMLGGSLQLTSPRGEGATFTVILPLEAPERVEPILVPLTPAPPTV